MRVEIRGNSFSPGLNMAVCSRISLSKFVDGEPLKGRATSCRVVLMEEL